MNIRIREATPEDTPLILQFIRALAEYEQLLHSVQADEATLRANLFGARPVAFVIIAEHEGVPAGFALYFYNFSTFLGKPGFYIEDLYVRPEYRGQGIGKALFSWLARKAIAEGCGRLEWWVLDWNEPSIAFYRKLGATPMDEWTVFRLTEEAMVKLADAH